MTDDVKWLAQGFFLPEGPRMDDKGDLYFGDVTGHGLYRCRPGRAVEAIDAERRSVGGVVVDEAGGIICSGREGLIRFDPATGERRAIPVVIDGVAVTDINDIEADAAGNLYGGTLDYQAFEEGRAPGPSIVFRLNRDGSAERLAERTIPNGMDFTADGSRFFLSESGDGVFTYAIAADGSLADRRLFAALPDSDGIALDSAGGLWVARYLTNGLEYYAPDGTLARRVALPFGAVASVTFGGPDLTDLIVAGGDLRTCGLGGILSIEVETPGLPARKTGVWA